MLGMQSCYSPQKLLDKGRNEKAINKSMSQYQKSSKKGDLIDIAKVAYDTEHQKGLQTISSTLLSASDLKYEQILVVYKDLQLMYDNISRNTIFCDAIHPINYSDEIVQYTDMATNVRFDRGQTLMRGNTKRDFQNAYFEFKKGLELTPHDLQIEREMNAAYDMAVTNVMIDYLHFKSAINRNDRDQIQQSLLDNLLYDLQNKQSTTFLNFYTLPEIYDRQLRTDQTILMSVDRFNITKYRDKVVKRKVTNTIKRLETDKGKEVSVEEEIHAELTLTTRSIKPQMRIHLAIVNDQNVTIYTDLIEDDYEWKVTWATYTGNKKALSEADLKLLGDPPSRVPNDAFFIEALMKKVQPKVRESIRGVYRRWGY